MFGKVLEKKSSQPSMRCIISRTPQPRVLSGKRFYVIGLIYENPNEFSYVQKVLNGALKACEAGGYTLLLLPLTLPQPGSDPGCSPFCVPISS